MIDEFHPCADLAKAVETARRAFDDYMYGGTTSNRPGYHGQATGPIEIYRAQELQDARDKAERELADCLAGRA